jgi:pyruvate-formate lyase-activating enzyme
MSKTIVKYADHMTFSVKKMLLELVGLLSETDGAVTYELIDNQGNKGYNREVRILVDGQLFVSGNKHDIIFERLKEIIKEKIKRG